MVDVGAADDWLSIPATKASMAKVGAMRDGRRETATQQFVSQHARARMQQRGIPRSALEYVLDFGREHHDHRGAIVLVIGRAAISRIALSGAARGSTLDELRGVYAVVASDGSVRTVGHRTRPLRRN